MNAEQGMTGLTPDQVRESRVQYGENRLEVAEERVFWHVWKEIATEPMFLLLLAACAVYFFVGQYQEGIIMIIALGVVSGISFFQEYRSRNAIQSLRKLSATKARVIRSGTLQEIPAEEIVTGDLMWIEEGELVAADGLIDASNDLSLNESVITGESFPVDKFADGHAQVYKGTLVTSGSARIRVSAVGIHTLFGKIGFSLQQITVVKTPLQIQIRSFVKWMVAVGIVAFVMVVVINFWQTRDFVHSLLHGLTMAMSILPEEIPVAFSTFQALGAFRLLRNQIIVKQPQYVETLGSATVICADKTGTLTQNLMSIAFVYDARTHTSIPGTAMSSLPRDLIEYAMWSSERQPFDPMEKAIHELYAKTCAVDCRAQCAQVHEYPMGGKPPLMTHVFRDPHGEVIVAVKGGPEGILRRAHLTEAQIRQMEDQAISYAREGYRVLGVGKGIWAGEPWPVSQEEFPFEFLGLIAFQDPPKASMREAIQTFHDAGIAVKMITGDYPETAIAIARQIGLDHESELMTGNQVIEAAPDTLRQKVKATHIYARMFPEAKLRVIDALKELGEVVAMTGDGVNDAPALKAAHIGIAMGQRGSEVAKSAASLILVDDDLAHMTEAIALGRKIYDNLKKAIRYIISIHIPIILIVLLPLALGWGFTDIFMPVHVIFLELIMGPTCSIVYESEPMEPSTMKRPPRPLQSTFLSFRQSVLSIIQGLVITMGCLGIGAYALEQQLDTTTVRTLIFITLLFCNLFLTLVNRSFERSFIHTIGFPNRLMPLILLITVLFIISILTITFLQEIFYLSPLPYKWLGLSLLTAFGSVVWLDLYKLCKPYVTR